MALPVSTNGKPPTSEQGRTITLPNLQGVLSWSQLAQIVGAATENVPDLVHPQSVLTYSRMRNDAQVNGLLEGTILPITRYTWFIEPNGADDNVVEQVADDVGLPIGNDAQQIDLTRPKRRSKRRFNFNEHQPLALLSLAYGWYFFEQVMEYRDADQLVHLRKLAERPPWTITEVNVEEDGGLKEIRQPGNTALTNQERVVGVDRLLCYTWKKEGGNWLGRSLLRALYAPWLLKDRVIRVGAINIERNGAGTPIIEAPPGADRAEIEWLDAMARAFRAGSSAGGAIPAGAKLTLKGVEGTQPDSVGFLKFLNEEMSRAMLMMFFQLGQSQSGSRALGGNFIDWFGLSQEAIATWYAGIFNQHMIEDMVDWNYGEDAPAPLLCYDKNGQEAPTDALNQQVNNGAVQVDPNTQSQLQSAPTNQPQPKATSRRGAGRRSESLRGLGPASPASVPARPLRRQPYEHEVQAGTDFATLDTSWESALTLLEMESRQLIDQQIGELHDWIVEADGNLDGLMEISASSIHSSVIAASLSRVAELATDQAVGEARGQGIEVERPGLDDVHKSLANRAETVSAMIARDVTSSATRRAIRLTGGSLSAAEVADQVRDELRGMSWVGVREQLGGALTAAQNAGRGIVFRRDAHPGIIYGSELLDTNTCQRCIAIDGTIYEDMDSAERDYPTGGYKDCEGRERCRGTVIKVYEQNPPTLDVPFGG